MNDAPKRPRRPTGRAATRKGASINVRVSEAEADELFIHAYRRRTTVSEMTRELLRMLLRGDARKPDGSS